MNKACANYLYLSCFLQFLPYILFLTFRYSYLCKCLFNRVQLRIVILIISCILFYSYLKRFLSISVVYGIFYCLLLELFYLIFTVYLQIFLQLLIIFFLFRLYFPLHFFDISIGFRVFLIFLFLTVQEVVNLHQYFKFL